MRVVINGEVKEIQENMTLLKLLQELGIEDKVMAAALNMQIVKQDMWATQSLKSDDKLELLDFVGGG